MTDWINQITGTPAGTQVALVLALSAAFLHAVFGALQKGRHNPWISRAAIDTWLGLFALPLALFVVPWPNRQLWPVLLGAMVIHIAYKVALAHAYQRGAYSVVYPVMRGSAPLFTVIAAGLVFHEHFNLTQWFGVLLLVSGIIGLSDYNRRRLAVGRETLQPALIWALITGGMIALYTTYDAWGIRLAENPFTFLVWFFLFDSLFMPLWTRPQLARLSREEFVSLAKIGFIGALVAPASFGSIMLATRIDDVGRAAVLRETSTVFSALVAWVMLGEKVGPWRAALMALIAGGAIIVELGA